jgi:hypothetical protein
MLRVLGLPVGQLDWYVVYISLQVNIYDQRKLAKLGPKWETEATLASKIIATTWVRHMQRLLRLLQDDRAEYVRQVEDGLLGDGYFAQDPYFEYNEAITLAFHCITALNNDGNEPFPFWHGVRLFKDFKKLSKRGRSLASGMGD